MTDSYSFTISQRVPWSALLEVAYVGNQSRNLLNQSGVGSDINLVPVGAMLSSKNGGVDPNGLNANNFRPLQGFAGLPLATHNLYANYNSMQVKYLRTKGRAVINMNYTFGKAMGIVSSTLDSFNLNNDYGVQSTNRTHIFNAAYSYNFGNLVRNKFAGGFVNGWQVSGIAQIQSGVNLTGQRGQNFGLALNSCKIPGTTHNVSTTSLLGTPNITLIPILTCDPTIEPGAEPVHQSELLQLPDADRAERADHAAGDLRTGVLQRRPRPVQELQDGRAEEAAIPDERVQLPESSAVVVQRQQPEPRLQRNHRRDQHAAVRHGDHEAGPPDRATGGDVHVLIVGDAAAWHVAFADRRAGDLAPGFVRCRCSAPVRRGRRNFSNRPSRCTSRAISRPRFRRTRSTSPQRPDSPMALSNLGAAYARVAAIRTRSCSIARR